MVYSGYLDFGGREIVNAARTVAYARTLLPGLDLVDCTDCDDLGEALGHAPYSTPLADQPSWYDPDNPDTWEFCGLYPLSFEGFEDSTLTATTTEFIGDGGTVSGMRRATRTVRVTGLLIGMTPAAVAAGMVWLRSALRPGVCGSDPGTACEGDHVSFFSSCPPVCTDSPDMSSALVSSLPVMCATGTRRDAIGACTLPYERHLYQTWLTDGPRVIQDYHLDCASMQQVEFTLTSGTASPFGTAMRVTQVTPTISTLPTIADVVCSTQAPGNFYQRVNWASNPGPTLTTGGGWALSVPNSTLSTSTSVVHRTGGTSIVATRSALGGTAAMVSAVSRIGAYGTTVASLPATEPGASQSIAVWARMSVAGYGELWVTGVTAAGVKLTPVRLALQDMAADAWVRLVGAYTAAAGVTRLDIEVRGFRNQAAAVGNILYVTEALIERGSIAGTYFDGAFVDTANTDYSWQGTVGQSRSYSSTFVGNIVIDPDCPPPPAAPRPPVIDETCIDDLTSYKRFTFAVPEAMVPQWSDLVPIVNVRALGTALRQLRVRFYSNPDKLPVASLPPCAYDGEFIVSYLPLNATMTIDGIGHRIMVVNDDGSVQQAAQLLYGTGGGPVAWPYMSCGDQFDVVVDVDPTATGLQFELCVAGRE